MGPDLIGGGKRCEGRLETSTIQNWSCYHVSTEGWEESGSDGKRDIE